MLNALGRHAVAPKRRTRSDHKGTRQAAREVAGEVLRQMVGEMETLTPRIVATALFGAAKCGVGYHPAAGALLSPLYCYVADHAEQFDIMHAS